MMQTHYLSVSTQNAARFKLFIGKRLPAKYIQHNARLNWAQASKMTSAGMHQLWLVFPKPSQVTI